MSAGVVAAVLAVGGCKAEAAGPGAGASAGADVPAVSFSPAGEPPGSDAKPSRPPTKKEPSAPASPTPEPAPPETLMESGDRSEQVRELQARLFALRHFDRGPTGYYGSVTTASVSAFQGAHGLPRTGRTDRVTWDRLTGLTRKPTRTELRPPTSLPVAAPDPRCTSGRVLCISKKSRTLAWMVDGKVVSAMDVRFGSQYTPTRDGVFKVYWKSRHHVSTLYDTPMPYALFFSGGQAVHYSSDFAASGYNGASHGCVNVRDKGKIASLFQQVKNGDKVVVYG